MEMMMLQQTPIIVQVVQQPVESTSLADVLVGAIGLTGALILLAVVLGGAFGGLLIGVKLLRRRLNQEPASDSDIIHIV
jgi:uncharacterized protein YneF (UPF0154 family)